MRLLFLLIIIALFEALLCYPTSSSERSDSTGNILNELLFALLVQLESFCVITITHDFETIPPTLLNRIIEKSLQNNSALIVTSFIQKEEPLDSTSTNVNSTSEETEYWFSWLHSKYVEGTKCGFHILMGLENNLPGLIHHLASKTILNTAYDHFLIWPRDYSEVNITSILGHPYFENMKYKLAVQIRKSSETTELLFYSICFYCKPGGTWGLVPIEEVVISKNNHIHIPNIFDLFPDFTTNLNGKFIVGTFVEGYTYQEALDNFKYYRPTQHYHRVMLDLGEILNFTWTVESLDVGESGVVETQLDDGSWTGMVAEILYKRVDFAAVTIMGDRVSKVIDYMRPFYYTFGSFMTRIPKPLYSWKVVIQPYTKDMWLGIFISCITGIISLYILLSMAAHVVKTFQLRPLKAHLLPYTFTYIFLTLIEENPEAVPTTHSARVFLAFWWLFAVVITCGYNSKLIGFLAIPEKEVIPKDLRELTENPKTWKWGAKYAHAVFYYMLIESATDIPHLEGIRVLMDNTDTIEECLERALQENYACLSAELYLTQLSCKFMDKFGVKPLTMQEEDGLKILATMALPKHSVLTPALDNFLKRFWSTGVLGHYHKSSFETYEFNGIKSARKSGVQYISSMALRVQQLQGVFFGLFIFTLFAFLILISEIINFNRTNSKKVTTD